MRVQYENKDGDQLEIIISGDVGIENIKELKDIFELRLNNSKVLNIKVKDIEYFDLSTLQLFIKTAQEARILKRQLKFDFQFDTDNEKLIDQTGITPALISSICEL